VTEFAFIVSHDLVAVHSQAVFFDSDSISRVTKGTQHPFFGNRLGRLAFDYLGPT
jgi:hypothetical protein